MSTDGGGGWLYIIAHLPPDLAWVEVRDHNGTAHRARAVYARDGRLPHWQMADGAVCSVRFLQWRPVEELPAQPTCDWRPPGPLVKASDDDVPIAPAWLEAIGFRQNRPCHVWGTENCNWRHAELRLEIFQFNDTAVWLWVDYDRVEMRTREHLRKLMAWLALRLPG